MSLKFTENEIEKIQEGNTTQANDKIRRALESGQSLRFSDLQKLSLQNRDNLEQYKYLIADKFKNDTNVKFAVDQAEVEKQASILPEVATQALLRDNSLLARLDVREQSTSVPYIRMREFNEEKDAEVLASTAAGTSANDTLRLGDKLQAETDSNASKVQASFTMNELSSYFMDGASILDYQTRSFNRVQNKVIQQVLYAGQGVANGTARASGQIRGIVNNYGVNGTGDATNHIGAITYTAAELNTATGKTTANEYDSLYFAKSLLLPKNVSESEETDYIFVMNKKTWGKVKTAKDLNGRYLASSAIDPVTGKAVRTVDGTPIVLHTSIADDYVFLIPPRFYTLLMVGGIRSINDNGLVQLKEGITTFVARTYIDGSMMYGHKYKSTTAATIGTTALDNQEQNVFRYFQVHQA